MMQYRLMQLSDLDKTAQFYMNYYNQNEDGVWTAETTTKRIRQVFTREDSYCLLLEECDQLIGFAMGYFEQYDDCFAYDLIEIVVAADKQNSGIGTAFMQELEKRVKDLGAMLIQLESVNDAHHEHFYGNLGYKSAKNLVLKTKML